jgi:Response regulator containing CheY-like receiver domain and AraC-type DNA-binding domain
MYSVLLVDDERIILEGISAIMDWEACGTRLIGTARNGLDAKALAEREKPDIIITDIRMPGMDGLQLVEAVKETQPDVEFIMLSGFGDFEYARTAMRYGVKHYLTKPCNERAIADALRATAAELDRRLSREAFVRQTEERLAQVLPHARERMLQELVTNKTYGRADWERIVRLTGLPEGGSRVRLLVFEPEGEPEFELLFALKNMAEELLGGLVLLGTADGRQVILLIGGEAEPDLLAAGVDTVLKTFSRFYRREATAALSEPGEAAEARRLYREALGCLAYRFYLGEGGLITKRELETSEPEVEPPAIDEDRLWLLVKSGHWEPVQRMLDEFFEALAKMRPAAAAAKSLLIPLYIGCMRQGDPALLDQRMKAIEAFDRLDTLQAMTEHIARAVREVCEANYERHKTRHSEIVAKLKACVREHLGNPQLSLHWAAREVLFMNPDYLGKLFRQATGEKFSQYVTRLRIEKAIEMIKEADDVKVYEIADRIGFGDNPQYFSQVFKRHTGFTPSEYKRSV